MELTLLELAEPLTLTLLVVVVAMRLPGVQVLEGTGEGQRDGQGRVHRLLCINST